MTNTHFIEIQFGPLLRIVVGMIAGVGLGLVTLLAAAI